MPIELKLEGDVFFTAMIGTVTDEELLAYYRQPPSGKARLCGAKWSMVGRSPG